jgi:hypothetical protein
MYVAGGGGFRAYDVASISNKSISQPIITAPFSALRNDTHVASKNATCVALPTNQASPASQRAHADDPPRAGPAEGRQQACCRGQGAGVPADLPYAVITELEEGLIPST